MIQRGSSRLGCLVPVHSFWWFPEPFLGDFLGAISRPFSLGFGGGCMHEPFEVLFPLIPKSVSKGARFWGFRCSRVRGVLGRISLIPLDWASFGGQNLVYGVSMRCSYYPQSLAQISGAIREIGSLILGSWPAGAVHSESSGHTGQIGADSY
jgi:hypothetical protein